MSEQPLVGVVMGSDSDLPTMQAAIDILDEFGVAREVRILSAHRTPDEMFAYAREAAGRGVRVSVLTNALRLRGYQAPQAHRQAQDRQPGGRLGRVGADRAEPGEDDGEGARESHETADDAGDQGVAPAAVRHLGRRGSRGHLSCSGRGAR